ncbi:hypothetical protein [Streptomyces sp. ODS28]|uniref:hypothetical protein n=1 Tax=Streptomyces sp. ODS28 TaxID=3136688 RepID=UPI0031E7C98E
MRRLAAPLIGATAALSVLAAPVSAAAAGTGASESAPPLKGLLKRPLLKDQANDICLAPTQFGRPKQGPACGSPGGATSTAD